MDVFYIFSKVFNPASENIKSGVSKQNINVLSVGIKMAKQKMRGSGSKAKEKYVHWPPNP